MTKNGAHREDSGSSGCSGSESEDDSDSTVGNPKLLTTFDSHHNYFVDDTILEKHPLPPLHNTTYLDRAPLDLGSGFSELDELGIASPAIVTQAKSIPSKKKSKYRKDKRPHKQNSRKLREREEQDDCRPDSDRDAFNTLQNAKHRQRLASRITPSPPYHFDMAGKKLPTRSAASSSKTADINSSDEENLEGNMQMQPSSKRNANANQETGEEANEEVVVKAHSKAASGKGSLSMDSLTAEERITFDAILKEQLAQDQKLSKDKRSEALKRLRRAHLILRFNNDRLMVYKAQVKVLQAELDQQKKAANARISKGKAKLLRESEDEKERIDKLVSTELWRTCKFINCKDDEDRASEFLYKLIYGETKLNLDAMYSWVETYKTHIKKCLYAKRNYATSQIKLSAWNKFENGQPLPTVEMVRKCVNRTIDVNNEEEMEVFQWYWEVLLPKMVGATEWGNTVRYYTTIFNARLPGDDRNRKLVTVSHEGMILAIWDNNFEKWHELYEWSQRAENKKKKQRNSGGKYTSTNRGQRQFGGWEPNGIEAYNLYVEEAAAGRKRPNRKLLEKTTLDLLRTKYNIDQEDHDTQSRVNRNRKRKKLAPNELPYAEPMVRIVKTKMLEDDPEDEMDSAEEEEV